MSGGYFTSNYSQMEWLADDLDEYRKIVADQPLEVFEVCEVYQPDFEKNPDLRKFTNDPLSTKHEVLHKIDQIKDLIRRACTAARAVDYLASGDYAPDSFLRELASQEKTFGKNWLKNEKLEEEDSLCVVEPEQSRKEELIDGIGGAITYLIVLFWIPLMKWIFG